MLSDRHRLALHKLADAYDTERAAFKAHQKAEQAFSEVIRQSTGLPHALIHTSPRPSVVHGGKVYTFEPASGSRNGLVVSLTELVEQPPTEPVEPTDGE